MGLGCKQPRRDLTRGLGRGHGRRWRWPGRRPGLGLDGNLGLGGSSKHLAEGVPDIVVQGIDTAFHGITQPHLEGNGNGFAGRVLFEAQDARLADSGLAKKAVDGYGSERVLGNRLQDRLQDVADERSQKERVASGRRGLCLAERGLRVDELEAFARGPTDEGDCLDAFDLQRI